MSVSKIVAKYGGDPGRLMDILTGVQLSEGCISDESAEKIASGTGLSPLDVRQTAFFYHFFTKKPAGKYAVYLNNSAVARMSGSGAVAKAFEEEANCRFGSVSKGGLIGLYETSDIGMNDQEPAALINDVPFTRLTPAKVKAIAIGLKEGKKPENLVEAYGDGENGSAAIRSMVCNNIREKGAVYFGDYKYGNAVRKSASMAPDEVLGCIKQSGLRGRGGAGFPAGLKWEFCKKAEGPGKYIICNADEGEPGTFKDRVILTELPRMVFEGMISAAYATGAAEGILYLRYEYQYLLGHLETVLADMRGRGFLGNNIAGKDGFHFDIRIQLGAGAYICGEESALIESAEGRRGEPRNRPPFPAQQGYRNCPTVVNNVETFAAAARIIDKGAAWFSGMGTDQSAGTKLLSVSGDCERPGVYEVGWGLAVQDMLRLAGASDVQAVQVGGPSGSCIGPFDFDRVIGFEDLATGGSVIIIGKHRNLVEIVYNFVDFFCEESCGSCAPCRGGTRIMRTMVKRILDGRGSENDLKVLIELGNTMHEVNKCGLGQTAGNPVVTSIINLRGAWEAMVKPDSRFDPGFDLAASVAASCTFVGRNPLVTENTL